MEYGSLTNILRARERGKKPEVGMGCTEILWTDRHALEIIAVKDDRHCTARYYDTKRTDSNGMSECQDYQYISNPNNRTVELFLTKKGEWRERYPDRSYGNRFAIGYAEEYYDYSF